MKKSILAMLLLTKHSFTDDAPAAGAAATVSVVVPAEHESLVTRILALLEKDATWLKDNIEAGVSHFEAMFEKSDTPTAAASTGAQAAVQTDAPAVSQNGPVSTEQ